MANIYEKINKPTPIKHAGHGKKDHPKHNWEKQEGDFSVKGKAVDYFKSTIPGAYTSQSIDLAKNSGPAPDLNKYLQGIYKRFGDKVTTRELIDKKYIDEAGGKLYDKLTAGKNLGIKGADTILHKYTDLYDQNTSGGEGETITTTTNTPGTQDYNMGWRQTQNANLAEAAQRRGNRRAARRATRDTWKNMTKNERKEARKNKKTMRQKGELKKGRLNKRQQMINSVDMDNDGVNDYNLRNVNTDAARIKLGEDVDLSNTSQEYQDRVRSSTVSKHSSALNKYGPKGPDNVTTVVTNDGGTGESPTTTNVLRPSVEGSTAIDDLVLSDDNITSDNLWGNGDFDPYGNINPFAPGKTKGSKKNKPAYKLKSSGILKKGHKRGAGY